MQECDESSLRSSEARSTEPNDNSATKAATAPNQQQSWRQNPDNLHSANKTLEIITEDNTKLRATPNVVQESMFDVELDEALCEMRPDTRLVLMDIPGLNEAGSKDMYRDYVTKNWNSLDCVTAVMDVFQGVNTEEQVQLLELIRTNNDTQKKQLPIIVLCNKVDDLENKEVSMLVDEVRSKVDEIFLGAPSPGEPQSTPCLLTCQTDKTNTYIPSLLFFLSFSSFHSTLCRKCVRVQNSFEAELRGFPKARSSSCREARTRRIWTFSMESDDQEGEIRCCTQGR